MKRNIEIAGRDTPKESIIDQKKIESRVMEFFQGVNLDKIGESKKGVLTIKTTENTSEFDGHRTITNIASVNGFEVAVHQRHSINGFTLQRRYNLRGQGESRFHHVSLELIRDNPNEEFQKEIIDVFYNQRSEQLKKFDRAAINAVAKIFGIKP